jgi:streptomycin 6-kinase
MATGEFFVPPAVLDSARRWETPEGPAWLAELPARVGRLAARWDLELRPPYVPGGVTSYAAPCVRADGTDAVLKVVIMHREARAEPAALAAWNGNGAVRLLEHAPDEDAMLLERCDPGSALGDTTDLDAILSIGADVLARLWSAPLAEHGAPFEPLEAVTDWFAELVVARQGQSGKPLPLALVDEAVEALRELPRSASRRVLLHHDFHPGNVLAAQRQPWLAIDPKPQVGDPAFDPLQLILQTGELWTRTAPLTDPDPAATIDRRVAFLCERLDLERERLCGWGVGRCVEWSLYDHSAGEHESGDELAECARIFSRLR